MGMVANFFGGARSLLEGMRVTLEHFFRTPVTVEYPHEEAPISKAQRNAIVLIKKEEAGDSHNCIACLQCEKICPSMCISITGIKHDGIAMKRPEKFDVNYALCSVCGLCLDVCPTETLGYSKLYDAAGYHRDDFVYDLLEPYRETEPEIVEHLRAEEARKKAERDAKRKAEAAAKEALKSKEEPKAEQGS
ncbi:NADH-quinone oxidoreductase subunit I [Candidatus Poribacteria bacterium]|nr:NADH-quinone oxidoreductase subunit I [Candidatus Poribacteria bacterium]